MIFSLNKATKKRINKHKRLLVAIASTVVISLSTGLVAGRLWYVVNLRPALVEGSPTKIIIEKGASESAIAKLLKEKNLIRNELAFKTYVKNSKYSGLLKSGTYELDGNLSTQEIVEMLGGGKESNVLFTIIPGLRLDQIKNRFIKAGYTEAEVSSAFDPAQYAQHPALVSKPKAASLEGYLYPESFKITATTPAKDILRQSLDETAKRLTVNRIAAYSANGLTAYQAITLASMIEKEVVISEDKRVVAQIFLKRLRDGISLGSDVTYIYAAAVFGGIESPNLDSPYNTRKYEGLPPGPIANVSESSLDAVAYPADTDYLFFISGDDGKTYYGRTLADHENNIRNYCQKLCGK